MLFLYFQIRPTLPIIACFCLFISTGISNFSYAQTTTFLDIFDIEFNQQIENEELGLRYSSTAFQTMFGDYEFMVEHNDINSKWEVGTSNTFSYAKLSRSLGSYAGFVVLGETGQDNVYLQTVDFQRAQTQLPSLAFSQLVGLTTGTDIVIQNYSLNQESVSIGVQWNTHLDWTMKFQLDHYRMSPFAGVIFELANTANPINDRQALNMLNFSLSTRF